MTIAENRERGHYVESAACDRCPLERVDDVVGDRAGVIVVLERDDLTLEQRQEIAETLSTRAVTFDVESAVSVETNGER